MRMLQYYTGLAVTAALALLVAACLGIFLGPGPAHLIGGLTAAALTVGAHTLAIVFMLVTGRVLREAMKTRPFPPEFLGELNQFFASKRAYPAAGLGAVAIVATGVLGYAQRGFDWPSAVHMLVGLAAFVFNLWALQQCQRALVHNQDLLDRAARELDRIDAERPDIVRAAAEAQQRESWAPARIWFLIGISAWMPYLYWGLIVWRGHFEAMARWILPATAAASALALVFAFLTRGIRSPGPEYGADEAR